MRKILPFILCLCLFAACKKDKAPTDPPILTQPEKPAPVEVFTLKNIQYTLEEGDGEQVSVIDGRLRHYSNGTSLEQTYTVNPAADIKETSEFKSEDKNAFKLLNDAAVKVAIPVAIDQNKKIYLGDQKWPYKNLIEELPSIVDLTESWKVPSQKQLNLDIKVSIRKYSTTYTATFVEQTSKREVTVKGKWSGTVPVKSDIKSSYQDIVN